MRSRAVLFGTKSPGKREMVVVVNEPTVEQRETGALGSSGRRTIVADHYEIDLDQPLGAGGMAVVYRGRDLRTRRDVALKTLRYEYRRDPETRARFRREARVMAFLTHPNVARVYDLYEDDDAPWVVLELVPGNSLKDDIERGGPFTVEEVSLLLDQVARALDHLQGRGLVHLDVKPQNLIRTPEGVVKLIDFGLAQRSGEPQEKIGGSAFGTAAYLAPEQAVGDPVDAATDVYALGCVVYELLTGRPPFDIERDGEVKNDVIRAHLEREPVPLTEVNPDLPTWVDDVVLGALAKRPADRYADCGSFARLYRNQLEEAAALDDRHSAVSWTPPVADSRPARRSVNGGIVPRLVGPFYRLGGRFARLTGGAHRTLWRIVAVVALANLLLAGLLYVDRGAIPGLYIDEPRLETGGAAAITTEGLRLRSGPGRDADVLRNLSMSDRLTVTGPSLDAGGEIWIPVRIDGADGQIDGYVAGEWLIPVRETATERVHDAFDHLRRLHDEVMK